MSEVLQLRIRGTRPRWMVGMGKSRGEVAVVVVDGTGVNEVRSTGSGAMDGWC